MVVPCYNEMGNLPALIGEYSRLRRDQPLDVILVDDGSRDGTGDFVRALAEANPWVWLVTHEKNQGFAQSLKDGLRFALAHGYDLIAQTDADLTHPPELIPRMLDEIKGSDMVVASRYLPGGGMKEVPAWRVWLSTAANTLFRVLLGSSVKDLTSGFRVSRRELLESIELQSDSFEIQLEFTVRAERMGFQIREVPFVLVNRKVGRSSFKLSYIGRYIPLLFQLVRTPRNARPSAMTHGAASKIPLR